MNTLFEIFLKPRAWTIINLECHSNDHVVSYIMFPPPFLAGNSQMKLFGQYFAPSECSTFRSFCSNFHIIFVKLIQHYFICRPSDSTVSEDAGIKPRTITTLALTARRPNHLARFHPKKIISLQQSWQEFS